MWAEEKNTSSERGRVWYIVARYDAHTHTYIIEDQNKCVGLLLDFIWYYYYST